MYAEIGLPYFKKGDDLAGLLDDFNGDISKALLAHSHMLETGATILKNIEAMVKDEKVSIEANCHHIGITGDDAVIQKLIDEGYAYTHEEWDEDQEDDIFGDANYSDEIDD